MRQRAWAARGLVAAAAVLLATSPARVEDPPPVTVALTLDTSGSVGRVQLTRARDLALAILAALPEGSEVAVLAFDDQSRVVVPRTSRPDEVRDRLAGLKVGGRYTVLHDALYDASRYVRDAPGLRRAIVLITDGLDENSSLNLEDGLRVATDGHIPVFAVGVGSRPQERVLRRIAKLTGGEYFAFDGARGADLATLIAAVPPGAASEGAPRASGAAGAGATRTPAPAARPTSSSGAASARVTTSGRVVWIALALTTLAAAAAAIVARARRRRRSRPACPICARPLPDGSSTCPSCSAAPTRIGSRPPPRRDPEPDLSATVLSRMNTTEEYLERTIILQERPVLAITRGPGAGQVFELSETSATSIGRSRANDIQVDDVSISGQHCRVRPEDGRFVLHDLRSTNGTLVNEKKVSRHVLEEGDVIMIGETALQYRREMKRG